MSGHRKVKTSLFEQAEQAFKQKLSLQMNDFPLLYKNIICLFSPRPIYQYAEIRPFHAESIVTCLDSFRIAAFCFSGIC
jgi:hypothetical protein